MMHGREKSDLAIVAMKPANKANEPTAEASTGANAAEPVERRAGAKGNAHQQSTHWTQSQARVSQALERIRHVFAVTHPRWEPYAGKPHVRFCAGACDETHVPTATKARVHHSVRRRGGRLAARGEQPAMPVVGVLSGMSSSASERQAAAFLKGLSEETGYLEGQNVAVEYHRLNGQYDQLTITYG